MALRYNPKIITDNLVLNLDPSHNKSYPTDLPVKDGLVMWMDAADDTTFSYSSGTSVSQWRDKSGLNNHVAQSTAANQPSRSSSLNSRKLLTFDGSNDSLSSSNSLTLTTTHTIFVVASQTTGSSDAGLVSINNTLNNGMTLHNGTNYYAYFGGGGQNVNYGISTSTHYIFTKVFKGTSSTTKQIYLNGTSATSSGTITSTDASGVIRLGQQATYLNGTIAEVIIFDKELSAVQLKQVHTYLGQKWGISNTDRSIIDLSGNGNDGLLGNGTTANMPTVDYYNNNSLRFDGSNDEVNFGDVIKFTNTQEFTLETWVNYVPNSTSYVPLISKEAASPAFGYALKVDETYNYYPYLVITGTQSYRYSLVNINDGRWHHVVGVAKSGTATIDMYIDGVLSNGLSSLSSWTGTATTNALRLGNNYGSAFFKGKLASSKIYNRALSADEILQNYEAQKSKFTNSIVQQGLILNLDAGNPYSYAGSGSAWYDTSGNGYTGTINNTPTFVSPEPKTFILNGSTQDITLPSNFNSGLTSATWEFWVNCVSLPSGAVQQLYIQETSVWLALYNTSGVTFFGCDLNNGSGWFDNNGGFNTGARTTSTLSANTWYHVTYSWDGSTIRIYLNGNLESTTSTLQAANGRQNVTTLGAGTTPRSIGSRSGSYFNGKISMFRNYNIALSAAQVLQNYNATKARFGL